MAESHVQRTVLIADRDPGSLKHLRRSLAPNGYLVVPVAEPADVLAQVAEWRPALVLLDVDLPGSLAVLDQLKRDESLQTMPVGLLSTVDSTRAMVHSAFGPRPADLYARKPLEPAFFDSAVERLLHGDLSELAELEELEDGLVALDEGFEPLEDEEATVVEEAPVAPFDDEVEIEIQSSEHATADAPEEEPTQAAAPAIGAGDELAAARARVAELTEALGQANNNAGGQAREELEQARAEAQQARIEATAARKESEQAREETELRRRAVGDQHDARAGARRAALRQLLGALPARPSQAGPP